MTSPTFVAGSVEYITVTVTSDTTLADIVGVAISMDNGSTWLPCTWQGTAGRTRKARTNSPFTFGGPGHSVEVLVRLIDDPEVPIVQAGRLTVVP